MVTQVCIMESGVKGKSGKQGAKEADLQSMRDGGCLD